jgi:WD40 repeat protein
VYDVTAIVEIAIVEEQSSSVPRCIQILEGHELAVVDIAWRLPPALDQQLKQQLVSASSDGTAQVWTVSPEQVEQVRK